MLKETAEVCLNGEKPQDCTMAVFAYMKDCYAEEKLG